MKEKRAVGVELEQQMQTLSVSLPVPEQEIASLSLTSGDNEGISRTGIIALFGFGPR